MIPDNILTISDSQIEKHLQFVLEKIDENSNVLIDGGHFLLKQTKKGTIINRPDLLSTLTFEFAIKLLVKLREKNINCKISYFLGDFLIKEKR